MEGEATPEVRVEGQGAQEETKKRDEFETEEEKESAQTRKENIEKTEDVKTDSAAIYKEETVKENDTAEIINEPDNEVKGRENLEKLANKEIKEEEASQNVLFFPSTKEHQEEENKALHDEVEDQIKEDGGFMEYISEKDVEEQNVTKGNKSSVIDPTLLNELCTVLGLKSKLNSESSSKEIVQAFKTHAAEVATSAMQSGKCDKKDHASKALEQKGPTAVLAVHSKRRHLSVTPSGSFLRGRDAMYVELVVGGRHFCFLPEIFQRFPDSTLFQCLFKGDRGQRTIHFDADSGTFFSYLLEYARTNLKTSELLKGLPQAAKERVEKVAQDFGMFQYMFRDKQNEKPNSVGDGKREICNSSKKSSNLSDANSRGGISRRIEETIYRGESTLVFPVRDFESLQICAVQGHGKLMMDVWSRGACHHRGIVIFDNSPFLNPDEEAWIPLSNVFAKAYPGGSNFIYRFCMVENSTTSQTLGNSGSSSFGKRTTLKPFIKVHFVLHSKPAAKRAIPCAHEFSSELLHWLGSPNPPAHREGFHNSSPSLRPVLRKNGRYLHKKKVQEKPPSPKQQNEFEDFQESDRLVNEEALPHEGMYHQPQANAQSQSQLPPQPQLQSMYQHQQGSYDLPKNYGDPFLMSQPNQLQNPKVNIMQYLQPEHMQQIPNQPDEYSIHGEFSGGKQQVKYQQQQTPFVVEQGGYANNFRSSLRNVENPSFRNLFAGQDQNEPTLQQSNFSNLEPSFGKYPRQNSQNQFHFQ